MSKTGCSCGVTLRDTYVPGGVCWTIYPREKAEAVIEKHPEYQIVDVEDAIAQLYDNDEFNNLWLCRRCRRLHIWKADGKYVQYRKESFETNISSDEILRMEEWFAFSDWDVDTDERPLKEILDNPIRPTRFYVSGDRKKIYVWNADAGEVEYEYIEEYKELGDGLWRDGNGCYRYVYKPEIRAFYEDGREVEFPEKNGDLSDAVYGAVIGDALGVPYEFKKRGTFHCTGMTGYGTHHQPAGTWSDDSSMILATCKSLKDNNGQIVIIDIQDKFRQWYYKGAFTPNGEVFDVGNATRDAIVSGVPRADERSTGYVVDTLEAALWCVLTSRDYDECLLKAVNLGDDTDTVASVAGALGSLKFCFDELPDKWVNQIRNNDLIQDCLF